jgi:hypothetical protein
MLQPAETSYAKKMGNRLEVQGGSLEMRVREREAGSKEIGLVDVTKVTGVFRNGNGVRIGCPIRVRALCGQGGNTRP